jgi:alpha-galactosidase
MPRRTAANASATEIKIAYIGGGSRNWARTVMTDLALCPHLKGEIALYDTHHAAAVANVERAAQIFGHRDARTRFRVTATKRLAEALRGADFVFMSILPGPMQMFANDLDIPARYGILQTVGDTTGPGGISRAMRTVPIYAEYGHQIMRHCPKAWVINYTNPMTLCTAALYAAEPDIQAFGCCHEVFGTQSGLAERVEKYLGVARPDRREIRTDVAGVNHFTFVTAAQWQGHDLFPLVRRHMAEKDFWDDRTEWSRQQAAEGQWFNSAGLVAHDFFRRFGALGAAGDRHLAEFVPWYALSEENLHRYGVVLTPSSWRMGTWQPEKAPAKPAPKARKSAKAAPDLAYSGEEGVDQLLALVGVKPLDTNVNLPNRGQMPGLPWGAVVETNAQFRRDSVRPVTPVALPAALDGLVRRVAETQQLTLAACLMRSKEMAFQALLSDALCRIPVDRAWKMLGELMAANKAMLQGWK